MTTTPTDQAVFDKTMAALDKIAAEFDYGDFEERLEANNP